MASLSAGPSADSTPTPHTHPDPVRAESKDRRAWIPCSPCGPRPGGQRGERAVSGITLSDVLTVCLSGKLLTSLNLSSLIPKWGEYLLSLYRNSLSTASTVAHLASLSITNSWSLLKLMSIESVMPSSHLTLCHPLLLLPVSSIVGT